MLRRALLVALAAAALGGCGGGDPAFEAVELERRLSENFYPEDVDLRQAAKFECDLPEGDGIDDRWSCVGRTQVPPRLRPSARRMLAADRIPTNLPTDRGVVIEMDVWVNDDGYFAGVVTGPNDVDSILREEGVQGLLGSFVS